MTDIDVIIVLHQTGDLRLDDNPLYDQTLAGFPSQVAFLPVFVFNPREFRRRKSRCCPHDVIATGPHAARALLAAVAALRKSVSALGSALVVRTGNPVDVVPALAQELGAAAVRWVERPGHDEAREGLGLARALAAAGVASECVGYACTLSHPADLPQSPERWAALAHPKQKKAPRRCNVGGGAPLPGWARGMPKIMGEVGGARLFLGTASRLSFNSSDFFLYRPVAEGRADRSACQGSRGDGGVVARQPAPAPRTTGPGLPPRAEGSGQRGPTVFARGAAVWARRKRCSRDPRPGPRARAPRGLLR